MTNTTQYPINHRTLINIHSYSQLLLNMMGDIFVTSDELPDISTVQAISKYNLNGYLHTPTMYMLVKLIEDSVNHHAWYTTYSGRATEIIKSCLKTEYSTLDIAEGVRDLLIELRTTMCNVLGNDHWSIFFVRVHGPDVVLERSVDYRVMEWEKLNVGKYPKATRSGNF